jgi:hypothetical protein
VHLEVIMDLSPCTDLKIHMSEGMRVAVESPQVWLLGEQIKEISRSESIMWGVSYLGHGRCAEWFKE